MPRSTPSKSPVAASGVGDEGDTSNTTGESSDSVRRSSRKRTTSKWLEDMHTDFATPNKTRKASESREDDCRATESTGVKRISSPRAPSGNKRPKKVETAGSEKEVAPLCQDEIDRTSIDRPCEDQLSNETEKPKETVVPSESKIETVPKKLTLNDLSKRGQTEDLKSGTLGYSPDKISAETVEPAIGVIDQTLPEFLVQTPQEALPENVSEPNSAVVAAEKAVDAVCELKCQSETPSKLAGTTSEKTSDHTSTLSNWREDPNKVHLEILNVLPSSSKAVAVVEEAEKGNELVSPTYAELIPASQSVVDSLLANENVRIVDSYGQELTDSPSTNGLTVLTAAATSDVSLRMSSMSVVPSDISLSGGHGQHNVGQENQTITGTGLVVVQNIEFVHPPTISEPPQKVSVQDIPNQGSVMVLGGEEQQIAIDGSNNSKQKELSTQTDSKSETSTEQLLQVDCQNLKNCVVETVDFKDLPDQIASIIKNFSTSNVKSGQEVTAQGAGMKYRVIQIGDNAKGGPKMISEPGEKSLVIDDGSVRTLKLPTLPWPTCTGLLKCSHCDYVTDKRANWYKHKNTHGGKRPYQCQLCDYNATTSSNLKRHMTTHTNVRLFSCTKPGCSDKFKQKIHLDRHIRYKHMTKDVKCELCDYTCATKNPDLLAHIKRRHSKKPKEVAEAPEVIYKCDECACAMPSKKDFKQHMKFHSKGPELKLYCEYCSFVTDCQSRLTRHLLVHTKEKPYRCGMCEYKASQKEHVIRHMRTKHKLDVRRTKQVVMKPLSAADEESDNVDSENVENEPVVLDNTEAIGETIGETEARELVCESEAISIENCAATVEVQENELEKIDGANIVCKTEPGLECEGENSCDQSEESNVEQATIEATLNEAASNAYAVVTPPEMKSGEKKSVLLHSSEQSSEEATQGSDSGDGKTRAGKKRYLKVDYSNLPKIFSCDYCTMRFAKLLNLYKHITVQHSNVHPAPPPGMFACVVCDFKTPQRKALLVHMRCHNPEVEETQTGPNLVFSCILCQYCTPKRRNLYWHLKKKHKISLLVNKDGTVKCVVEENGPVSIVPAEGGGEGAVDLEGVEVALAVKDYSSDSKSKVVNVTDLAQSLLHPKMSPAQGEVQVLATDGEVFSEQMIAEVINIDGVVVSAEDDDAAAVAIEGLQALAEQAIPPVSPPQIEVVVPEVQSEVIAVEKEQTNFQLSPEQVMQLSSGDYVEIDGEMYKVEFASDDSVQGGTS